MDCTRELFAHHNLRCTKQRVMLFQALRACKTHPTAEELYRMVQVDGSPDKPQRRNGHADDNGRPLSRATVYNTLEALCRAGLVRRLPTTNGCCRFDADTSDHLHVRFRDTHEIRDVPPDLGRRLVTSVPRHVLREIEDAMGVRIDGVNVQLIARHSAKPQA